MGPKFSRVHVTEIQPAEIARIDEAAVHIDGGCSINDVFSLGHIDASRDISSFE
jgi:hypothetical protein